MWDSRRCVWTGRAEDGSVTACKRHQVEGGDGRTIPDAARRHPVPIVGSFRVHNQTSSARRAPARPTAYRATVSGCLLLCLAVAQPACALEATGVLLQAIDPSGQPLGPVWHTSSGQGDARALGITGWVPNELRRVPLSNRANGEIDGQLLPGTYILTAFWQYRSGEFPPAVVLNLYFNGDNLTPGISAVVSGARGLTRVSANTQPTTLSLYLRDVDNNGGLFFDDSVLQARLGAAFYLPTSGPTDQWRPSDLMNLDRVGVAALKPDGIPDAVLIYELFVEPSVHPLSRPGAAPQPARPGVAVPPLAAQAGADLWMVPPTMPLVVPTAKPGLSPSPDQPVALGSTPEAEDETPTVASSPAPTAESGTPRPEDRTGTPGRPPASPSRSQPTASTAGAGMTPTAARPTPDEAAGSPTRDASVRRTPRKPAW
jgi:hypothetical protein